MKINSNMIIDIVFQSGEFINPASSSFNLQSFIQMIVAIGGLSFALYQYRNYDIKKQFRKKQLETVIELTVIIEKTVLTLEMSDGKTTTLDSIKLSEIHKAFHSESLRNYFQNPNLVIGNGVLYQLDFLSFSENLFLPMAIAEEVLKLSDIKFEPSKTVITETNYIHLKLEKDKSLDFFIDSPGWGIANPELQTLETYLLQILKIKTAINKWLKKFDVHDLNIKLNIAPKFK